MLLRTVILLCTLVLIACQSVMAEQIDEIERELIEQWSGPLISLDLESVDIDDALQLFGKILQVNIVAHPEVVGKIRMIRFVDVHADQAFETVLTTQGLYAEQEGNVIIVYPFSRYLDDAQQRLRLRNTY